MINHKLLELFELCVTISDTTEHDVFFSYMPHVNVFSVYYYVNGWEAVEDAIYPAKEYGEVYCQIDVNDNFKIEKIIYELKELL